MGISGDIRQHWMILGDIGRYWAILSDIKQYRLYYMGISIIWDTMITVPTECHCVPLCTIV